MSGPPPRQHFESCPIGLRRAGTDQTVELANTVVVNPFTLKRDQWRSRPASLLSAAGMFSARPSPSTVRSSERFPLDIPEQHGPGMRL